MGSAVKSPGAFKTIGELCAELGVAQHILRYWETKFPQLRPLQRAGNRRYYRPDDVALAHRINRLLNEEGYTVRGVQKLLSAKGSAAPETPQPTAAPEPQAAPIAAASSPPPFDTRRLSAIRDKLAAALDL